MFKKLLVAVMAVVVVLGAVSMTRVGSRWASCFKQRFARWEKKQITPEMELAHLKDRVDALKNEEDRLNDEISVAQQKVKQRESELAPKKAEFVAADERLKVLVPATAEAKKQNRNFVSFKSGENKEAQDYAISVADEQISRDWAKVKRLEPMVKAQDDYLSTLRQNITEKRARRDNLEKMRYEMGKQLLVLEKKLAEAREKQRREGSANGGPHAAVSAEINKLADQIDNLPTATSDKGPIEVSEENRSKKDKDNQELNNRYAQPSGTPVKN